MVSSGAPSPSLHVLEEILTFLLAGHHTIAAALTWTLYLTSRAPEWEARMLEEIRQVVPSGPVTGEHIDKLVTVQQVLTKSMRLFPPLPVMSRYAAEDVELAGEYIKAGTLIGLPIYVIHRHRKLWDDPDRFDPSRFAPGRDLGYSRYQFMPFGVGPRICIGAAFALIEATAMLATLVRAARLGDPVAHKPEKKKPRPK